MKKFLLILLACAAFGSDDIYEGDLTATEAHEMQKKR